AEPSRLGRQGNVRPAAQRLHVDDDHHASRDASGDLRRAHSGWVEGRPEGCHVRPALVHLPSPAAGDERARPMKAREGMTLMELVIALVITGLMAVMGTATLGSIIDHRRVITTGTTELERASALRDQIRTWMLAGTVQIVTGGATAGLGRRGAAPIAAPSIAAPATTTGAASGMPGMNSTTPAITAAVAGGDEITFVTTADNPANSPSARMRLFIDADPNTPETDRKS